MVVLAQTQRIPAAGAEIRLNVPVQQFSEVIQSSGAT